MFPITYMYIMSIPVQTLTIELFPAKLLEHIYMTYLINDINIFLKLKMWWYNVIWYILARHLDIINVSWNQRSSYHGKHCIRDFGMALVKLWHGKLETPYFYVYMLDSSYTLLIKPYSHALAGLVSVRMTSLCWQKPIHLSSTPKSHVSQW